MLLAATLVTLALLGSLAVIASRPIVKPGPGPTNGWIAFTNAEGAIYFVKPGTPAELRVDVSGTSLGNACPAFSPDGTQLAYGRLKPADGGGPAEAVVDIDTIEAGRDTARLKEFPVGPGLMAPCPLWSPDGKWLAFALSAAEADDSAQGTSPTSVRLLFVPSGGYRDVEGQVQDIDWSPDSMALAVASGSEIRIVNTVDRAPHAVPETTGAQHVSWSPDGRLIAWERPAAGQDVADLVVVDPLGSTARTLVAGFHANHGIGPVWSPDGHKLVYQRLCSTRPDDPAAPCREQHDVVVLTAPNDDWLAARITETVMPESRQTSSGTEYMWPFFVTWSPDSSNLLYNAWSPDIDDSLIAVPLAPGSVPTVLVQSPDVSPGGGPGADLIQTWQRAPVTP
jgi:Tol biopolymer transport system component